ncbi:hypothetical protein K7I13_14765 [Brucepastera parasyntrophica]|uniref:hypothetical protein n=1 Tax=Brucepastera parasyntrophica TaxID=2880008 RepID=UPI00210BEF6B|nr:hypothetical protein [Brucepastera parasyntrophica]ULQ59696.1 hypothetical protein K7I13_14765 [Brucepastera parasyntrophica]
MTDRELRDDFIRSSQKELLQTILHEIPGNTLGDWKDTLESVLFLLFRHTELYRGSLRLLVTDSPDIQVKMYPEGTFLVSSALLDYIDITVYENAAESSRRIRNLDAEREALLVPFLAIEAAHFALDQPFTKYKRITEKKAGSANPAMYTDEEIFKADSMALVLMELAEFSSGSYINWLKTLGKIAKDKEVYPEFSDYLRSFPAPESRLAAIEAERKNIENITGEFSSVLTSLRTATAFSESAAGLAALQESYPHSSFIMRLNALILHQEWFFNLTFENQFLQTFFPVAQDFSPYRNAMIALAKQNTARESQHTLIKNQNTIPGNVRIYNAALDAYKNALEIYTDPAFSSSYAMLLARKGTEADRNNALSIAENAAAQEAGSHSIIARTNYATLLFLMEADSSRAYLLLENLVSIASSESVQSRVLITEGFPGDFRDILLNQALMMRMQGNVVRLNEKLSALEKMSIPENVKSTPIRFIAPGDNTDELLIRWGQPSEIVYNYYTEKWMYPSLAADIFAIPEDKTKRTGKITLIKLKTGSPISPAGNIRTGDSRADFESVFGSPLYQAGDSRIYLKDGNRYAVLYLAGKIRQIIISR